MKLLLENTQEYIPAWQLREFWNYNINPITGKKAVPRTNRSSEIDATVRPVKETHNSFVSMHV